MHAHHFSVPWLATSLITDNAHAPLSYSRREVNLVLNLVLRARVRFRPAEATCGADQKERSLWERECLVPRTRARIRSADATRPNRLASLERNEAEMNCTLVRFSKKFTIMSLRVHDLFERSARPAS